MVSRTRIYLLLFQLNLDFFNIFQSRHDISCLLFAFDLTFHNQVPLKIKFFQLPQNTLDIYDPLPQRCLNAL